MNMTDRARWLCRRGIGVSALFAAGFVLTLRANVGWWAIDMLGGVVGISGGAVCFYWDTEPPRASDEEFAAMMGLAAVETIWWPGRSSIGVLVPLWLPAVFIGLLALLCRSVSRRSRRRNQA